MKLMVAIPTIGMAPQLPALVEECNAAGAYTNLYVNREDVDVPFHGAAARYAFLGCTIYQCWNYAIKYAAQCGYDALAILNDDITLHPDALTMTAKLLLEADDVVIAGLDWLKRDCPPQLVRCHGGAMYGGVGGYAFVVKPDRCPLVDEQFIWYYGDDDLFLTTERQGGAVATAWGCGVDHSPRTTSRHFPEFDELGEIVQGDMALFRKKWGRRAIGGF